MPQNTGRHARRGERESAESALERAMIRSS